MSDGSSRLDDLPAALTARFGSVPRRLLYLSRNDVEPARLLEAVWPSCHVTILTKVDFQGLSLVAALRRLRSESADLFVVHDRPAAVERLDDLYRLAATAARARRRFLLSADFRGGALVGAWRLEEVRLPADLPGLAGRLLAEGVVGGWGIARTPFTLPPPRRHAAKLPAGHPHRVAYLRSDLDFVGLGAGGSVSHTLGVIGGLVAAGHDVRVLSADPVPGLESLGVTEEIIPPGKSVRIFDEAAMVDFHHRFVARAFETLHRDPPDFLYQRHAVFNATGAVLARKLGRPLLLEANHTEVGAKAMWSRLTLRSLAERMEGYAFAGADAIVAVSAIGKEALVHAGADRAKVLVNPNGVDPARFHPGIDGHPVRRDLPFSPDDLVAAFLGTFTRWHGVLFLADQIPALVQRHPNLRFLFMGDGDLRSAVEDRLRAAGVAHRAVFTGLVPHGAVPGYLAAADILISPHLPFEDGSPFFGSPTKLFEYMAMGKAVVASNLGQIGEVIEEGKSGILYGPGSAQEFQRAMDRVVSDAAFRRSLGEGARRRVESEFTWRRNAERAVAFLEERLSGRQEER